MLALVLDAAETDFAVGPERPQVNIVKCQDVSAQKSASLQQRGQIPWLKKLVVCEEGIVDGQCGSSGHCPTLEHH